MTLTDIKLSLYRYLQTNNQVILPDDNLKIITISETPELHYASIIPCLETFEAAGFGRIVKYEELKGKNKVQKTSFILDKPLQLQQQTITINGDLALLISEIVNSCDKDRTNTVSTPLAITAKDIEITTCLCEELIRNEVERNSKQEEEN